MRLPESKIKEAILHPDRDVREMAVQYFADCFSQDKAIMSLFIQSVEKYGWQNAIGTLLIRFAPEDKVTATGSLFDSLTLKLSWYADELPPEVVL